MASEQRKRDHLKICIQEDVETPSAGFEDVFLINNSLPEMDLKEVDTSTTFLGREISMPLKIAAITGGTEESRDINRQLAVVAETRNIIFELGSQRAMIDKPSTKDTYYVRDAAPNGYIIGNLGISQLKKFKVERIRKAVEDIGADAISIHLNAAQEAFQVEGDVDFSNLVGQLAHLCNNLSCPVIGKEVGTGISREVAQVLKEAGVKAIDVGGRGGTNWIVADAIRSGLAYDTFANWGIPTSISILESQVGLPVIATGGLRTGLDVAKSIALGADLCGMALPFLKVLMKDGHEGLGKFIDRIHMELKLAMFLTGSKKIEDLKKVRYVLTGRVMEWVDQRKLLCRCGPR